LLADEPPGALDLASAIALADLLVQLNQEEQVTLIIATHCWNLQKNEAGFRSPRWKFDEQK
jgi:ABC-type lipoprotein export system ATPase subunit